MGRRGKIWLIAALLVILGGFLSIVGILNGRARSVQRIVMDRWAETLGTPAEIFAAYPSRETNDSAVELVEVAAVIGIELAPRHQDLSRPTQAAKNRFMQFKRETSGWLKRELSRSDDGPVDTPDSLRAFMWEFRGEIDHVIELLLREEGPAWELDLRRLWDSPIPNLIGHTDLTNLLIARSYMCLEGLAIQCAERTLEASWRLGETLKDDPTPIVLFVRLNLIRTQAAAVRRQPLLDHWIPRLDGQRYREAMERSLLHEGWLWPQYKFRGSPEASVGERVQGALFGPYMELATADASERWRRRILQLRELDSWCREDVATAGVRLDIPMPWWNRYGGLFTFDLDVALARLVLTQQQMELTRKILELGVMRRGTEDWPGPDDSWLDSEYCSETRWLYTREFEKVSLRLNRVPDAPQDNIGPMTWEYSLSVFPFLRTVH